MKFNIKTAIIWGVLCLDFSLIVFKANFIPALMVNATMMGIIIGFMDGHQ